MDKPGQESAIGIPLLHIADPTGEATRAAGAEAAVERALAG